MTANFLHMTLAAPAPVRDISIATSAMLVMFKGSYWQGTVKDRQATQEVTQSNNAESGSAVVNKKLLPNCAELDAIKRHIARARLTHYQLTFDWMGELRCLPVSRLNDYMDKMDEERREHERLCQAFYDVYSWELSQAPIKLGNMYNASDYFTLEEMKRKFGIEIRTSNIPEAGDWRVDITNQALVEQRERYKQHYQQQITHMVSDYKDRLIAALSNISSKLVPAPEGEKSNGKRMHSNILSNVLDILPMADAFGLGEDSQIAAMRRKIEGMLDGVSVDALKHDPLVRDDVKRGVDALIRDLPSIDFN
jgi:hypothetical protein